MRERCIIVRLLKNLRAAILPALLFMLTASAVWGAPTVTAVEPPDGSNPPVSTTVSAIFSEPMDPATITNGSFTVSKSVKIKAIAAGAYHTVVLKTDGTVAAWGDDNYNKSTVPPGLSGITAVAAGNNHTLALKSDGTVVSWGSQKQSSILSGVVAISAGFYHSLALKNDGTVVTWGDSSGQNTVPADLSGVVAISAGYYHSLALKNDGTVTAWGANTYGQSTVPADLSGVVAIAAGSNHSLALKNDGTVIAWGYNDGGQSTISSGLYGVVAIAAGGSQSSALKDDGTVVAWGRYYNNVGTGYSQTTVPPGLSGVVAISAGTVHNVVLKNDGTVDAWGGDSDGQTAVPQSLYGVAAIAAGLNHSLALKNNGNVVAWGNNNYGESTVPSGLSGVFAIAAGSDHSLALKNDGTVVAWGSNVQGQSSVPVGLSGVAAIAAGWIHSLALRNDGTVAAWGNNNYGQSSVPPNLSGVVAIATGIYHSLALKNDGTVVAWGNNIQGQSSVPPGLSGVVAISAEYMLSLALKNDGTVVAWGRNYSGNIMTPPSSLSGVVAIFAGYNSSYALKNDGTMVGWSSSYQVLQLPPAYFGAVAISNEYFHTMVLKKDGTVSVSGLGSVPLSPYETAVQGSVIYDQSTNTATFTPSTPLDPGATYIGTVNTGVRSVSGEYLATDVRWSFSPGQQANATIVLTNLSQPYDGTPKAVTETTDPPGLAVSITYNGSTTPPTAVGSYTVAVTVNDAAYAGSTTAILTITNPIYTIGVSVVGGHGSISCDSPVTMGGASICNITPDANYYLAAFTDNNEDKLGAVTTNSYAISNVAADHIIQGTFAVNLSAKAGPSQTITCSGPTGAQVTLDASASTGAATYTWSGPFGAATGVNPTVTIPWGTHIITLTVTDGTGITSTSSVAITVTDNVPPLINVVSNGTNGNNTWFVSGIDMGLNAADSCSGMREIRYTLDNNAEQVVTGAAAGFSIIGDGSHTVTYRAIDNAGNEVGNSITFKIDSSAPAITGAALTQPNSNGWYNGNVTVHFSATDALSGIASLTPNTVVVNEGAGQSVSGTAVDVAGNSSSNAVTGINVDKTPPVVTITGVTNGATYNLGLVPQASVTAVDGLSGVATSSGNLALGVAQGLGQFTYTVTAIDKAGNTAITSVAYTVNATTIGTVTLIEQLTATGLIDQQTAENLSATLAKAMEFYANGKSTDGNERMAKFINQVNASGNNIPPDIAAVLINAANYIIAHN